MYEEYDNESLTEEQRAEKKRAAVEYRNKKRNKLGYLGEQIFKQSVDYASLLLLAAHAKT